MSCVRVLPVAQLNPCWRATGVMHYSPSEIFKESSYLSEVPPPPPQSFHFHKKRFVHHHAYAQESVLKVNVVHIVPPKNKSSLYFFSPQCLATFKLRLLSGILHLFFFCLVIPCFANSKCWIFVPVCTLTLFAQLCSTTARSVFASELNHSPDWTV